MLVLFLNHIVSSSGEGGWVSYVVLGKNYTRP